MYVIYGSWGGPALYSMFLCWVGKVAVFLYFQSSKKHPTLFFVVQAAESFVVGRFDWQRDQREKDMSHHGLSKLMLRSCFRSHNCHHIALTKPQLLSYTTLPKKIQKATFRRSTCQGTESHVFFCGIQDQQHHQRSSREKKNRRHVAHVGLNLGFEMPDLCQLAMLYY